MAQHHQDGHSDLTTSAGSNVTSIADARKHRETGTPNTTTKKKPATATGGRNINYEKVAALKSAIESGTYRINARRIADKFIEREGP